jgi:hypothetical protein
VKEVNWKSGQPNTADGHCIFVQFSEKSANQTFVSMGDCSQKRKFICQVIIGFSLNYLKSLFVYDNNIQPKTHIIYNPLCAEENGIIRG